MKPTVFIKNRELGDQLNEPLKLWKMLEK
ncbi:hypothetical protein BDFB_010412 [Asbolus verrucosus]|uniref:Uncharacterized protein n=1 Tax=Asbolus verrucosus TaxID=1661398 RepID=A0A482W0M4_ASBVE|nr:hypothetical protein BDFB_010412 [Asbolus verrucosus]